MARTTQQVLESMLGELTIQKADLMAQLEAAKEDNAALNLKIAELTAELAKK